MNEQGFRLLLDIVGPEKASALRDVLLAIESAGTGAASSLTGMEGAAAKADSGFQKVTRSATAASAATAAQAPEIYELADAYEVLTAAESAAYQAAAQQQAATQAKVAADQAATAATQAKAAATKAAADAERAAADAARELAAADREQIQVIGAAIEANRALADAAQRVNQLFADDSAMEKATAQARLLEAADRDLADGLELLAIDERHQAEMARFAADALNEERSAIAAAVVADRDLAAASKQVAAASDDLNRALAGDAADEAAAHAASLRSQLDALGVEAGDVAAAFARGDISARVFAKDMDVLGDEAAQVRAQLDAMASAANANAAATDKAAAAQGRVGKAAADGGKGLNQAKQGFLDISRAAQDLAQGGFGGIINNLEGIGRGIPALLKNPMAILSSLPGLLTIAGTAIFVFGGTAVSAFRKIMDAIGPEKPRQFGDEIEKLKTKIADLEKKELKLPVDTRDLDEAKRKLDALSKAQAAFDAQRGLQNKAEAESGKDVQETLKEAPGGAEAVSGRVAQQYRETLIKNDKELNALETMIGILEAELADPNNQANGDIIRQDIAAAKQKRKDALDARTGRIQKEAERMAGEQIEAATKGTGERQKSAQEELADRTGFQFDKAADLEAYDAEAEAFQAHMDRAKATGERRRANAAIAKKADDEIKRVFKESLTDELDIIKATGDLDKVADTLTAEAKAAGLEGRAAVERVKEGVDRAIVEALGKQKFEVPKGHEADIEQPIGDLATQAAKAARIRSGQAEAKEEKGDAAQAARAFWANVEREVDADIKEFKAEVKRIKDTLGKPLELEFEARTAANTALREAGGQIATSEADQRRRERAGGVAGRDFALPQGVLEGQLQAQIEKLFKGRGATDDAARVAAKDIAGKGAVDLAARDAAARARAGVAQRRARPAIKPRGKPVAKAVQPPAKPAKQPPPARKPVVKAAPAPGPFVGPPKPAPNQRAFVGPPRPPQHPPGWRPPGANGDQPAIGQRVAAMTGQELANTGKLIAVAGQLNGKLAMQEQQLMQQGIQIAALVQNTIPKARTNRNRGRGG